MKKRTTVYVDESLLALARANRVNVSALLEEVLVKTFGKPSVDSLQREAMRLAQQAEEMQRLAHSATAEKENLRRMAEEFKRGTRRAVEDRYGLSWVVSRRGDFGFKYRDPLELLQELKKEIGNSPEVM